MRFFMAPALALALPLAGLAADWDVLSKLRPGERVWIRYAEGSHARSAKAQFTAWTVDGLTVHAGSRDLTLARNDVRRVSVYAGKSRARGAGIGALVGGAAGAAVYGIAAAATGEDGGPFVSPAVLVLAGAAVFAIIGAVVGLAVGKTKTEVLYSQ